MVTVPEKLDVKPSASLGYLVINMITTPDFCEGFRWQYPDGTTRLTNISSLSLSILRETKERDFILSLAVSELSGSVTNISIFSVIYSFSE